MLGIWDVEHVGCWRCEVLEMYDVRDMGCSRCLGCGMFWIWVLGMWGVGCLSGCGMLIYKMPPPGNVLEELLR